VTQPFSGFGQSTAQLASAPFAALNNQPPGNRPPFYGSIPADTAFINDLFDGLLEFKFRDVSFPVSRFRTTLRQDLAIHKFIDRDGAHIEGTGRAPIEITARIPFLNGLAQGTNETWPTQLYPVQWRAFFTACADKTSGPLQHPELGLITCKCEIMDTDWDATVRSGTYVAVKWLESDDEGIDLSQDLSKPSPVADMQSSTANLDAQLATLNPNVTPQPYVPSVSFSDIAFAIRGVFDLPTLVSKAAGGQIANLINQANLLEQSLNSGPNRNALNWPILQAAELAKTAAYDVQATLLQKNTSLGLYAVMKDSTLAQIAANLGADVGDIMILNPTLVQAPLVSAGTVVTFYQ
jgi:hypothetical protein